MKRIVLVGLVFGLALLAMPTSAQAEQKSGGVIRTDDIVIVDRVHQPVASVDVTKIPPKLTLVELRQRFLDRIEASTRHDPF